MVRQKQLFIVVFRVVFVFVCLLLAGGFALAQETQSPLPKPTAPVSDIANVIDQPTEQRLNDRLKKLQAQTKIEIAVVTVGTTGGQDIFDYSLAVARGWGIGSKEDDNPSLLLLVAIDDRKYFTQVSRDLEGDLPDGVVGQIQREELVPHFRQGRYSEGINDTIEAYINRLAQKRGFTLDGSQTPRGKSSDEGLGVSKRTICCLIVVVVIVFIVLMAIANRRSGGGDGPGRKSSGWRGGGFGGIVPIFIPTGGWSSGSDSGGSWGGGDSSGGSDWGGFGGGGDFGGGGAGGDW